MAKWGEGDPRWIVEDRPDATNVNNWHWTEKNATPWSRDKLRSLLEGLVIDDDQYFCEVTELTKIEGEACANNRKAKLIFFYEFLLKGDWKGRLKTDNTKIKGNFEIPNLSEENEPEDLDIQVSTSSEKDVAHKVKEFMRVKGAEVIREKIGQYIKDLKSEFSQGMILPKNADEKASPNTTTSKNNQVKSQMAAPVVSQTQSVGVKINCKKLADKVEFKCTKEELYRALTEREMICAFTRDNAQVETERGGKFMLFGGNVLGEFTELVPGEKIGMQWRFNCWPSAHYSSVTLTFTEKEDCTELKLVQTGIPESEFEKTQEGWKRHYWEPVKQTFGFGSRLF